MRTGKPDSNLSLLALTAGLAIAVSVKPVMAAEPSDDTAGPNTTSPSFRLAQAAAGTATSVGAEAKPEEVVVTGSSLKSTLAQTGLPIQVLTATDIARTGATTIQELLQQMPAADSAGSTTSAQATGFGTGGATTISLRGLGASRTLILINGRRIATFTANVVDTSAIPVSMIERIEILKDGASAVYGSDAIAGVVNFILRKDYQGAEVSVGAGSPTERGGGQEGHVALVGGLGNFSSDRYNVTLGVTLDHVRSLLGADRSYANRINAAAGNDVTSGFAFPANVAFVFNPTTGRTFTGNPTNPTCAPTSPFDPVNPAFATQCRFDNSGYDSIIPEVTRITANLSGRLAVGDSSELYLDASFWNRQQTTTDQPVPLSYQNPMIAGDPYINFLNSLLANQYPAYPFASQVRGTGAFLLPPTSPYYPTAFATAANHLLGQPLNLIYRDFANGLREELNIANTLRVVGGFRGEASGWNYDTSILYSRVIDKDDFQTGFPLYSKIMPLLDSGTINPFGPTTDPTALANAKAAEFVGEDYNSETTLLSLGGSLSRDLFSLPAGPLSGALGFELRRDTYDFNPSLPAQQGDLAGQGGNTLPVSVKRNVESAYLEFRAEIAKGLSADISGRFDNYQNVGNTTNPEMWIKWTPTGWASLRGTAGTGFRAPSLTDLYAPQVRSVTSNGTRDPIQCPPPPGIVINPTACSFQFTTLVGGNPKLTPEKSKTYTVETVFTPVENMSLDFNAFWVYLNNAIVGGGLNYATILQNAQTATQFANYITRDSTGFITLINQTNANLFKVYLSGLDSDVRYAIPVGPGRITIDMGSTYFYRFQAQNYDFSWTNQIDQGLTSVGGTNGGIHPRFQDTATIGYVTGAISFSVTELHQNSYHDTNSNVTNVPRVVSAYDRFNTQLSYHGLKSFTFTVGVKNITNRAPPYANYASSANNFVGGFDLSYGDPLGRDVYGSVSYYIQ
jgi:iron complex outermembrane receptor protein